MRVSYATKMWAIPRDLLKPTGLQSEFSGLPSTLNRRYAVPPPRISTVMIKQTPRSRSPNLSGSCRGRGRGLVLDPINVYLRSQSSLLFCISALTRSQGNSARRGFWRKVCSDQSNPSGWMTQTCPFSVANGILDVTEVGPAEINGCVDTRSRVLVFRF
jgi:hypothetical protein